jgi:putative hemolysin
VIFIRLLAVLFLIFVNAFFAATEFALVTARMSRVRQLIAQGNPNAKIVAELAGQLERVVSGVQVGVTLTTLGLGFVGEVAIANAIRPLFWWVHGIHAEIIVNSAALAIAYILLTTFLVVVGELVPKALSLNRADRVALIVARPFRWYLGVFSWAIDLLDGMARQIVRALGVTSPLSHTMVHSAEELQIVIQQARERGVLAPNEERFVQGAIELSNLAVREIMVPRPDMHAVPVEASLGELTHLFARTQRSRLPVYQDSLDHIVGTVHIKDLFGVLLERDRRIEQGKPPLAFDIRRIMREPVIVPESKPASELLAELRSRGTGMALVVDEFGSILGLVTLEDAIEQVVGEIHDEFDLAERPVVMPDGSVVFDASLNVRDLEVQYGIELPEDPAYSTLGGFALAQLGIIPQGGEAFEFDGYRFTVAEMDHRRISRLKLQKLPPPETAATSASGKTASRESSRKAEPREKTRSRTGK